MRLALALAWGIGWGSILYGEAGAFDPKSYIEAKQEQATATASKITAKSIYRIDGRRYQKMISQGGVVYLLSLGSKPEMLEEFALCQQHLKLMREVIPVRENIAVEPEILQDQAAIIELIRKCNAGVIRGPTLVIENPDGSKVEVKAKKDRETDLK